jgi:hypothetical protein
LDSNLLSFYGILLHKTPFLIYFFDAFNCTHTRHYQSTAIHIFISIQRLSNNVTLCWLLAEWMSRYVHNSGMVHIEMARGTSIGLPIQSCVGIQSFI